MTDKSHRLHGALPIEHGEIEDVQSKAMAVAGIPKGLGIWQLTTSFHFPSAMPSVMCSDRLSRNRRAALKHSIQHRSDGISKDQKALFDRLAAAEGRLRLTFASGEPFDLVPIYNEPTSAEQISPTLRRQSLTLLSANPFNWLAPETPASFSFRNLGATAFFNDLLLWSHRIGETELPKALGTAVFNVAAILADRRSHMLAQGLAQRTYNVFLPAGTIHDLTYPARSYILIPVLSFIRLSNKSYFRRTFSLSVVMIPVSRHDHEPRGFDSDETAALQSGWTLIPRPGLASYSFPAGELGTFIAQHSRTSARSEPSTITLRELVQDLLYAVVRNAVDPNPSKRSDALGDHIRDLVLRAVQTSICAGCCSMMPDISVSGLHRWQASPVEERDIDRKLSKVIIGLVDPEPMRLWAIAEPSAFRLRHGRGAEPLIPTFYFSFGLQRLLFTPCAPDLESQNSSMLWVVGWHLLLMTGVSALLEMLNTFHHEMENRPTAVSAQAFLKEFLTDLEEYFDFELLPVYRLDFDALKRIEGIDNDFERLRERVSALGQDRIIEEGRTTNRRLLLIAVASLLVSLALLVLAFKPDC